MSKYLVGVVVLIIIALGIWYFVSSSPAAPDTNSDAAATSPTDTANSNANSSGAKIGTNTFKSIFTQSGNTQCTYEVVTPTSRTSSVVDISGGKMHGEFRTTSASDSIASIMVYTGGYLYVWDEGKTSGTKTQLNSLADLPQAIPTDLTSAAIFGTSGDNASWDCHPWATDTKLLAVPTYVTFRAK